MYLDEDAAKREIENIVISYTGDFKIYPIKRKPNGSKKVSVFMILKIKSAPENETLFNEFMKKSAQTEEFKILESELLEENKVVKELFLFQIDISVFGI